MKTPLRLLLLTALPAALLLTGCAPAVVVVHPHHYGYGYGAPPADRVEVIGVAPYHHAHWVHGHWVLRERGWVWIPGHWRHNY